MKIAKKILISLVLVFTVLLKFSTTPAYAICRQWVPSQCAAVRCNVGGTWHCCDTTSECTALNGSPMQNNPGGSVYNPNPSNSNPTCNGGSGIDTAIGCIPVEDTNSFMGWILGWAIGVGGGIAFLLIVYASFMIMTSQGDPTRLKAGQELLTSAISGLIMLIFSVFILKFIGIDILKLDNL